MQTPRLQCVPLSNGSAGQEAVELAATAGLFLDPWQAYVLENSLGERFDGKWAAREVCVICSRQNGKGSILEARELAGLFLFGERELVHTAHQFKTSADHFRRIEGLIRNTPDLMRKVKSIRTGNNDPGIALLPKFGGCRLRFVARSVNGSGRGFAEIDLLALDEGFDIPQSAARSLLPTQLAASNPQTWYTSSVEDRGENTEILLRKIEQGRKGASPNFAYFEWSATPVEGEDADTPANRAQANPGLGIRLAHEGLQAQLDSLGAADFAIEHLSIWPKRGHQAVPLFGAGKWEACKVAESRIASARCFGVAVAFDLSKGAIGAAGLTEPVDGVALRHVEPIEHRDGTDWIVDRALALQAKWTALFVIDGNGPAADLIPALQEAGVQLVIADSGDVADAYSSMFSAVRDASLRHMDYPELNAAVDMANTRTMGDRVVLGRKVSDADISVLEAVQLAAWGSSTGQVLDYDLDDSVF